MPLHCLYWWMGWSTLHLLLCRGYHLSFHPPSGCREASMLFKCNHCTVFFVKCSSSCFSSFNPSYPSSDSTHTHRSFTIHSEQCLWMHVGLSPSRWGEGWGGGTYHCSLFQLHVNLCHFRIKCGAATCWVKQSLLMVNKWECSGTSLM